MFNLTINSTNVANSLNNMYQYQFKNGAFEVPANAEMMITSFQIPYSWYNITTRYNNNSFKIHWPTSTVNSITLTNGGSGYTSVPTVAFTPTNTTVASVTVTALDGIPGTRVTGHPCPGTLVPGHFFIFLFLFFWRELIFLGKKMEKNCVFSLFFLSFSLYFSLSLYTQFGFFLV